MPGNEWLISNISHRSQDWKPNNHMMTDLVSHVNSFPSSWVLLMRTSVPSMTPTSRCWFHHPALRFNVITCPELKPIQSVTSWSKDSIKHDQNKLELYFTDVNWTPNVWMSGSAILIEWVQSLEWLAGILEGIALDNETVCLKASEWLKQVDQIPISLVNVSALNMLDLSSLLIRFFCKDKH